jgi:membrane protein required for colicin V production
MPTDFNGFDYVVLSVVGLAAVMGLVRGLVREAISLGSWVVGGVVVRLFHHDVTLWLAPRTGGQASAAAVAFLLLFFGVVVLGRLVASFLIQAARASGLGPADRLLGFGFGALKGVILSAILFLMIEFGTGLFDPTRQPPQWLTAARSAPLLRMTADAMVHWVREWRQPEPGPDMADAPAITPQPGRRPGRGGDEGYSAEDREALDRLLENGKGTDI